MESSSLSSNLHRELKEKSSPRTSQRENRTRNPVISRKDHLEGKGLKERGGRDLKERGGKDQKEREGKDRRERGGKDLKERGERDLKEKREKTDQRDLNENRSPQ